MDWLKANWRGMLVGALITVAALFFTGHVQAADLGAKIGGDCCADLEERIAELEASTARKDNKKVSVTIYGQVSEELRWVDGGAFTAGSFTSPKLFDSHMQVQSNTNRAAQSLLGVKGEAQIAPGYKAGFVLEVGLGGVLNGVAVDTFQNGLDANGLYTRQTLVYIKSDAVGKLSIGKQELATYNITGFTGGNTNVAHTKMSLGDLIGAPGGSILDLWDGGISDSLKYTSPHFWASKGPDAKDGVWVEADWANADQTDKIAFVKDNGNLFDVAIKAVKTFGEVEVGGGIGYRDGATFDTGTGGFNIQDIKVWSGSAYVKHTPSGLFLNGSYGTLDFKGLVTPFGLCKVGCNALTGWEGQVGDDFRVTKLGRTTVFAEYAQYDLTGLGLGSTTKSYGLGIVQAIDPAAMDLYLSWQRWQPDTGTPKFSISDIDVVEGGMRIKF
jgi:predicted porin